MDNEEKPDFENQSFSSTANHVDINFATTLPDQVLEYNTLPCKRLKVDNDSSSLVQLSDHIPSSSSEVKPVNQENRKSDHNDIRLEYSCSEEELKDNDTNYFRCYADLSIHRVMIGDYSRTQAYRRAILTNYKMFHQKVVLDVGAGTGILSVFCAQAGAKKVYAVEASSIAEAARKVVATNGYSHVITVIEGKMEDAVLPEKVDIIVSEWMGYMLMYESMLPSLLQARDRYLKENGRLFPEEVRIYIAPITDHQQYEYSVDYWHKTKDDYKVDMSILANLAAEQLRSSVHVMSVDPASILSHASCVTVLELSTVPQSLSDSTQGSFKCNCFGKAIIHGFVIWFTVHFPNNIVLSTSPYERETHWEQSVLYITPEVVEQDTVIDGKLFIRRGEVYRRFLDIELEYHINGGEKKTMKFKMKD
ncbi:protein arginine N-methyltransferase 6 isoform X1 [Parasteatoda tepidariorum]|nr:protein arginine N-methyltransferase 6 isoform X2 [Parasteatoda tepidariorum]XP_042905425.1 protein arginine N-methyltransferase 6 isoform X2 [Parasteatoda tepidariorum]XP_042905426.1 protein arginine N-methyltransferase 6 isoform X2 [Parasteatoda tepidariorum]XP_042905427.1 protein arginine N-methyltransferase 6 isoform X2 [Parasteatoda tepidariorum]